MNESNTMLDVIATLDKIKDMLRQKNAKYGDSALSPQRIFSRADPVEQICVRIDDKLSRLKTMGPCAAPDEDTLMDLIGYLVLLMVARNRASRPRPDLFVEERIAALQREYDARCAASEGKHEYDKQA